MHTGKELAHDLDGIVSYVMQYRKSLGVSADTLCTIRDEMVTQVGALMQKQNTAHAFAKPSI